MGEVSFVVAARLDFQPHDVAELACKGSKAACTWSIGVWVQKRDRAHFRWLDLAIKRLELYLLDLQLQGDCSWTHLSCSWACARRYFMSSQQELSFSFGQSKTELQIQMSDLKCINTHHEDHSRVT